MAITHLTVDNGLYEENVANIVVKNLYDIVTNPAFVQGLLKGTIIVEHAHPSRKAYLEAHFTDLHIIVTGDDYIDNDDPSTVSRLASHGDGVGLTIPAAATKTNMGRGFNYLSNLRDASFFQYFVGLANNADSTVGTFYQSGVRTVVLPSNLQQIGDSMFFGCSSLGSITIPDTVTIIGTSAFHGCTSLTDLEIPSAVTRIGTGAFTSCQSITSITIPNTVTEIGLDAFYGCTGLVDITLSNSLTTIEESLFESCTHLSEITIPNSVTSIGPRAFYNCTNLATIIIPDSVTNVGTRAFDNTAWYSNQQDGVVYVGKVAYLYKGTMPSNTDITILNGTVTIQDSLFYTKTSLRSVSIPDSVTEIGRTAFRGCTGLISISIPNSITVIKNQTFYGCSQLASVTLSNALVSIEGSAFYNCSSITSITLPNTLTTIGEQAFYGCSSLASITIPSLMVNLGNYVFRYCSSLASIAVDSGNTKYDSRDNCNAIIETESNKLIVGCNNSVIPNTVVYIGDGAFYGCSNLGAVTIPNSVERIGEDAFYGTNALVVNGTIIMVDKWACKWNTSYASTDITIPAETIGVVDRGFVRVTNQLDVYSIHFSAGLKYIGYRSFYGHTKVNGTIRIPEGVTIIREEAFYNCNMTEIVLPSTIEYIGKYAFYNSQNITVTINKTTPPEIASNSFPFTSMGKITLYVPHGCLAAYQVAYMWKDAKSIIELPEE